MIEDAGLSVRAVARAARISHVHLQHVIRGEPASLAVLERVAVVLGADVSVRLFPGSGPRIRDRIQARMVEALLRALRPGLQAHLEVPIRRPVRGYIDLVVADRQAPRLLAIEAQSELRRLDEQIRRHRDVADGLRATGLAAIAGRLLDGGPTVDRVLLLRSTVRTRDVVRRFEALLSTAYPAAAADLVAALTGTPRPWPGSGIVWVSVDGDRTRILTGPPRGIALGR